MINAVSTAFGALASIGVKQAVTANNIANVTTPGFKASSASTRENSAGGVSAVVAKGPDKVEISQEAVNMLANRTDFTANLKIIKTADNMTKKLLDILA